MTMAIEWWMSHFCPFFTIKKRKGNGGGVAHNQEMYQ